MLRPKLVFVSLKRRNNILPTVNFNRAQVPFKGDAICHTCPSPLSISKRLKAFARDALQVQTKQLDVSNTSLPKPTSRPITAIVRPTDVPLPRGKQSLDKRANDLTAFVSRLY
jgi:hypothetical protein